jgi:hypothetical protein
VGRSARAPCGGAAAATARRSGRAREDRAREGGAERARDCERGGAGEHEDGEGEQTVVLDHHLRARWARRGRGEHERRLVRCELASEADRLGRRVDVPGDGEPHARAVGERFVDLRQRSRWWWWWCACRC